MPIASYKLPDGRIVDYEVPEGMSPEEIDQAVASDLRSLITPPPAPKKEESGFFRQTLDVPVNVAKGAVTGVRMIADAFGANNPVSEALTGAENYLGDLLSAQAKNDQQEIARIMKEAEDKGVLEQVKAGIKALTVAPVDLISNALGTAAPTLVGGLASATLRGGALATSALMGGTGAVMGAGTIKGEIYQATKQALLDAGTSEDQAEARAQLAQSYGGQNLDQILLGGAIGGLAATTGVEKALAGPLARSILGRAALKEGAEDIGKLTAGRVLGAAGKEAIPEGIQGGQEQLAQNIALQREGFDVPTMRGVAGQAALEGLVGGLLGGAVDVAQGSQAAPKQPAPPPPGTTETETTTLTGATDPATMTPTQRYVELFNLRRQEQTDEIKARIAALEEMNVQDAQRMLDERAGKEPTSLEEQIKQQPPLQMAMRDLMAPETGVRPADQFAGPLPREAEFGTVLTPEVLLGTGLKKQSGFFKELAGKDLKKDEDRAAVNEILQRVRRNEKLSESTKAAVERVTQREFATLATQQEMFGPRGGVRADADAKAQEERRAAQEAKAAEKAAKEAEKAAKATTAPAPTVEKTAQPDLFTEEAAAEPETKAEIPDTTISEKTFEQLGVGPTNKKLREQILGKDLTDAAQAAEVRDALEDFANAPNRSKKLRDAVEQFLVQPFFAGEQRGTIEQPGAVDTGAGEPSVSVPREGQRRPTGPVPLDLRGLGSAVQNTGTAETGEVSQQRPLKRFVNAARKAYEQLKEEGDAAWEDLTAEQQSEFMDAFAETKPKMKRYRLAAEGTKGMPADKVRKLVDRLTAKWKNPPDIFVVQSVDELADYGLTDIDPTAKGVFYGGDQSVFLIADNITDYSDAVLTVAHESIGHFGLQSVLGDKYNATMDRLYETNEEVRTLADKKIKEEGLDKRVAVEEVLAEAVEKKIIPNSGLGRAIATLRNLIRNFLNLVGAKATNSEIDALIAQAANYVVGGTVQVNKKVTDTDAFKDWFGDSVIRNPDGSPKIMYHGTAQDISTFRPQQAKAIFVTDSPEFADVFTRMSEEYLLRISRETGTDYTGGRNILPLYVRAERPFDYESKADVNRLIEAITKELGDPQKFTVFFEAANIRGVDTLQELKYSLMTGNWRTIENPLVQDFIKSLGFDSFYVKENGRKNLAVYDPNQVKSATGNVGSFRRDTGDIRLSKKEAEFKPVDTQSQNFKNWFKDSKVVDKNGKPLVVYHGTQADIAAFDLGADRKNRAGNPAGFYFAKSPEEASRYANRDIFNQRTEALEGANVIPIYLSITNPFNYTGDKKDGRTPVTRKMFEQFEKELRSEYALPEDWMQGKLQLFKERAQRGGDPFPNDVLSTEAKTRVLQAGGYDGMIDGSHWVAFKPEQIKSAISNVGTFDSTKSGIRYRKAKPALTAAGEEAQSLLDATRGIANEKARGPEMSTLKKVGAFFLDPSYRQNVVDRLRVQVAYKGASVERKLLDAYNGAIRDSLGNIRPDLFMTAAEHSDTLTVAVMKDGTLRLDKDIGWVAEKGPASMTGVMDSIKALGQKLGDQDMAFKLANNAFIARRARALKSKDIVDPALLPSEDKINAGLEAFKKFPELEAAFKQFTDYKNGLIDAMVEGGRLSKDKAQEWKDAADYVPWNRIKDFEETIQNSPQMFFKGLTNLKQMKAIKGGEEEINDIFDNMVGLSFWMVNSAVRNHAALQLTDVFVQNNLGAKRVYPNQRGVDPNKTIYIYRNGEPEVYEYDSIADVYAFKGVESVGGPLLKSFTAMSNFLRKTTTAMPQFAFSQLPQDAYRATVMSGTRSPFKVAAKVIGGYIDAYKGDATTQRLEEMGIVGMYDLMPGRAREEIEKEFGLKQRNRMEKTINALESFSIASDTALRKAVFEQTLEETKSEQFPEGDVLLARYRAQEIINFKRQGSNRTVGILRQMVPFMNAYIQGMDVFYRTATGRGISAQERGAAFRLFLATGVKLMTLSLIYAMLVGDDDEYKGLRDYEKDKHFVFPGTGMKVPVAPEVAFFFKVLPERAYHYITSQGTNTPQDATALRKALGTAMFDAFTGPNLTPQAIKPVLELAVNYSFFTGTPIVGRGMENREARYQFTSSTSELAKMLGDIANVSPLKIDYFLRGTTGIAGGTALDVSNMLVAGRPERNLYQMPFFKTFMYDKIPGGYKEQYYDLRNRVDQVADTMNALKAQGNAEELDKYLTDKKLDPFDLSKAKKLDLLALRKIMNNIDQKFEKNRVYKNLILNDPSLSGAEKTKLVNEINEMENEMLRAYNIADLRKNVAGL